MGTCMARVDIIEMLELKAGSPSEHVCTRFAALREPGKTLRAAHEK
jgi:hypothetical protein